MKILWVNPVFPYPLYSGGQVRAYHLLKRLAQDNEVTLFSFIRPGREQGPVGELKKFCYKVKTFPGRKTWQPRHFVLAGLTGLPFAITPYVAHRDLIHSLENELKEEQYDLLHLESFYTFAYAKRTRGLPVVLGNENIEYKIYQRYVEQQKYPINKLLSYDIKKMKKYEESAWRKADLNLAVSNQDAVLIEKVTGHHCPVVENGVDVASFSNFKITRPLENRPDVLFVGDFKYFANQDAVNLLLKRIWPKIKDELPQAKLWLVGRHPGPLLESIDDPGILVDTQVRDIRQAYAQADVMIAPMRFGSGTNIKVLEAMAMGLPVVATSVGAEGIGAKPSKQIVVEDDPGRFARAVCRLLENENQRKKIGSAGRTLVKKNFDWSKIGNKLNKIYQEHFGNEKS